MNSNLEIRKADLFTGTLYEVHDDEGLVYESNDLDSAKRFVSMDEWYNRTEPDEDDVIDDDGGWCTSGNCEDCSYNHPF